MPATYGCPRYDTCPPLQVSRHASSSGLRPERLPVSMLVARDSVPRSCPRSTCRFQPHVTNKSFPGTGPGHPTPWLSPGAHGTNPYQNLISAPGWEHGLKIRYPGQLIRKRLSTVAKTPRGRPSPLRASARHPCGGRYWPKDRSFFPSSSKKGSTAATSAGACRMVSHGAISSPPVGSLR